MEASASQIKPFRSSPLHNCAIVVTTRLLPRSRNAPVQKRLKSFGHHSNEEQRARVFQRVLYFLQGRRVVWVYQLQASCRA